jgi:large subunit ribosomal protein L17
MIHQSGRKKLNVNPAHRRSLLRNQVIHLITYGHLVTTTARAKETRRLAERVVTIAREGNTFNARRRVKAMLPYKDAALDKLFTEIAPKYTQRAGGYTRVIPLGKRVSDTAQLSKVEWV